MEEKQKQNIDSNQANNSQSDIVVKPVSKDQNVKSTDSVSQPVKEVTKVSIKKEEKTSKLNAKIDKKPFIAGNFIKIIVFLLISVSLIVGNFFLEQHIAESSEKEEKIFTAFDYDNDNNLPERAVFRFADKDLLTESSSMDLIINNDGKYLFELNSGRVWGNLRISNAEVNILIGNVLIVPSYAAFDLDFNGSHIDLSVYHGDVYVAFLKEGFDIDEYIGFYSDYFVNDKNISGSLNEHFINTLLVPQNTGVNIPLKKVNTEIGPLLRSKLVKEFKYAKIPNLLGKNKDDLNEDELLNYKWIKDNLDADNVYINIEEKNIDSKLSNYNKISTVNVISDFIFWAEENLIFIPEKKREVVFDHVFVYLDNAIYYLLQDDEINFENSIQEFKSYLKVLPDDFLNSEEYFEKLDTYFNDFKFFDVSDNEYKFLEFLLEENFLNNRKLVESMNLFWNAVYSALDNNDYDSELAFDNYYETFDDFLVNYPDEYFHDIFVDYHDQLLANLFLHYPVFYKKDYFDIKRIYETNVLSLVSNEEELKQDFISQKITFLKHLRMYFFDDRLDVEATKEIYLLLLKQIEELMSDTSSLAVTKFFESELANMNDFYGYLSSSEYHSSSYGSSHEERYNAYLDERTTFLRWIDIKTEISDEDVVEEISVDDVKIEIEEIFVANDYLTKLIIGEIEDSTSRYVPLEFVLGGYPVKANYDRSLDLLTEVYVYDGIVTDSSVKLENLLGLLQDKFTEGVEIIEEEEEMTIESIAERTAKKYIADEIAQYGFVIEIENITVVEELNAIYRVEDIYLEGFEDKRLMFDILMANDGLVTDILMVVDRSPVMIEGKYTLEELSSLVASDTDF